MEKRQSFKLGKELGRDAYYHCITIIQPIFTDRIMRNARLEETEEVIRIAGRTLNNLRYAKTDTTLMAGKAKDVKSIIRRAKREREKAGMYFNIKKTKIVTTEEWRSFEVDGVEIEVLT